jgi:hypothetical protein
MCANIAILGLLLSLVSYQASAETVGIASGTYDYGLMIGFNPATQVVTGFFSDETGGGNFTCTFYIKGTLSASETQIATYFPDSPVEDLIKGQLLQDGQSDIRIRLPSEHGGCWNVEHFADDTQPANFTLSMAHPWVSVAVVKSAKTYFYDTPTSATHRKGYVVKGDAVGVRAIQPGWLQVDFPEGEKPVSGWIKQSDIY